MSYLCDQCAAGLVLAHKIPSHAEFYGDREIRWIPTTCDKCGEQADCVRREDWPANEGLEMSGNTHAISCLCHECIGPKDDSRRAASAPDMEAALARKDALIKRLGLELRLSMGANEAATSALLAEAEKETKGKPPIAPCLDYGDPSVGPCDKCGFRHKLNEPCGFRGPKITIKAKKEGT